MRVARAVSAFAALALLAGCAVGRSGADQPTWVPKPEGPPPADAPQDQDPNAPGDPNGGGPAQSRPGTPGDVNVVATGLRLPWGLVLLPDGTALVGERTTGRILSVQPRHGAPARQVMRIGGLDARGDGGLLDLVLSPAYREDKLIFAYVSTRTDNRVVRFKLGGRLTPVLTGIPHGRVHNGGRLAFDQDGQIFVGTGDAGRPALAADPRSLAGKVLHITTFGGPARGNPDPRSPVYSRGHSNVTGLCPDGAGRLVETEPGSTVDEVNQVRAGRDYGWPTVSGAAGRAGRTDPVRTLARETGDLGGCAVLERGLFLAALRGTRMWALPLDEQGQPGRPIALLDRVYGRLRTVVAAPDGALWLTTSNRDGVGRPVPVDDRVIRIVPPAGTTNSPT